MSELQTLVPFAKTKDLTTSINLCNNTKRKYPEFIAYLRMNIVGTNNQEAKRNTKRAKNQQLVLICISKFLKFYAIDHIYNLIKRKQIDNLARK